MKQEINAKARVYEVIKRYPETTDYFLELGLCGCCFGELPGKRGVELTLADVAREKNMDIKKLLKELKRRI